jgi:U3 small nucleolar RNA-associated protein 16
VTKAASPKEILPSEEKPSQKFSFLYQVFTHEKITPPPNPMLSKLINSARNIFNPTRQHKKEEQQQSNVSTTFEQDMVITRGQRGKHASDDDVEDSIVVETPKSSRKRQRTSQDAEVLVISDDEEAETRVAKKPKILPVRAKDEEALQKSQPVVEISSSQAKPISIGRIEDKSKQTRKAKGEVAEVQDSNASQSDSAEDDDAVEELEHSRKSDAPSPEKSRRSNKENLDSSPSKLPTPTKPQHKRFASEELEPEFFSTALEKPESEEEEESEDEDEAPEVLGAEEAIKSTKLKEREAQKVVEE